MGKNNLVKRCKLEEKLPIQHSGNLNEQSDNNDNQSGKGRP
jgi:hypothetical protein